MSRMHLVSVFLALFFALSSCSPRPASPTPQVLAVYATAAAQPWLPDLYACADQHSVVVRLADSPAGAQIQLRIGQPQNLTSPAYQIDTEEILVVTNRESPVQNMSADQARALFNGAEAEGLDVWVFAPGEDVQQVFDREVMLGAQITSLALLATSPQQMSDALNSQKNGVGILPRHLKAGTVRDVFTIGEVPVLAVVNGKITGVIEQVLACLQK
jgi:hypothetical protein